MKKILKISQKSKSGITSKALGCSAHSGFCDASTSKMPLKQSFAQKNNKKK